MTSLGNLAADHGSHLTYDGVHMNDHGNALIAQQLAPTLMKALAERK